MAYTSAFSLNLKNKPVIFRIERKLKNTQIRLKVFRNINAYNILILRLLTIRQLKPLTSNLWIKFKESSNLTSIPIVNPIAINSTYTGYQITVIQPTKKLFTFKVTTH